METGFDSQTEVHSPIAQRQSRELLTLRFLVRIEVGELEGLWFFQTMFWVEFPAVSLETVLCRFDAYIFLMGDKNGYWKHNTGD
jgi:hypothetical protein